MRAISCLAGIAACLPGAVRAEATCDLIGKAMLRLGEQPAIHQKTWGGAPPKVLTEAISLPDAMYVREGGEGPWRRTPFDQAKRRALAESTLKGFPLSTCTGPKAVAHEGQAYQAFGYRQPDPLKPGQFSPGTLWVGADGLPRRMLLEDGSYQTMEYGAFSAPSDVIQPRTPRRG